MKKQHSIPKLPGLLIKLIIPNDLQQSVIGDLEEEFGKQNQDGIISFRLWYWLRVFDISGHFLKHRFHGTNIMGNSNSSVIFFRGIFNGLGQDLTFAARSLRKSSAFALIAIFALALGIAANTAIFSVVNAVLLRPLPYKDADRLMTFTASVPPQVPRMGASGPEIIDFRMQSQSFDEIAALDWAEYNLTQTGEPEQLQAGQVSENFFRTLGVSPLIGSDVFPDEETGGKVAVLSNSLWQNRFGGDPKLPGKSILLDGQSYTVLGVMPPSFQLLLSGITSPDHVDVWIPQPGGYRHKDRGEHRYQIIAKLKPGITQAQAQADMTSIADRLNDEYYSAFGRVDYRITITAIYGEVVKKVRPALLVLLGAVAFVLLIACVNVANLLLSRAVARVKSQSGRRWVQAAGEL
jgi:predicted permease